MQDASWGHHAASIQLVDGYGQLEAVERTKCHQSANPPGGAGGSEKRLYALEAVKRLDTHDSHVGTELEPGTQTQVIVVATAQEVEDGHVQRIAVIFVRAARTWGDAS